MAKRKAVAPKTPLDILYAILDGKFESELTNGKTLVSVSDAGGSTSFTIMQDLSPSDLVEVAGDAIDFIESQPDPTNPRLPNRIMRLRASFAKTQI
jgi:hypothetical protein